MNITKITIGRLYNLGNYEHIRYELTAEVKEGENATDALVGMERVLAGLKPLKNQCIEDPKELARNSEIIARMKALNAVDFQREYGHCAGTPAEIIERFEKAHIEQTQKAMTAVEDARQARLLLADLGGACQWKDCKLDWENYDASDDGLF